MDKKLQDYAREQIKKSLPLSVDSISEDRLDFAMTHFGSIVRTED